MNENAAGRAFPNLLQGAKFKPKSVKNEGQIDPKSSPNRAQIHPNRDKVLPRRPPDPIGEKNVRFCLKCSPKWSQNTSQMEAKSSENRLRKRVDFHPCFFIVSGWFLGGKSGRKSSQIAPRRRSEAKTCIFRKCWFYCSKTIIFEARGVPKRAHFGRKSASGASRGAGSKTYSEKVRFSMILEAQTEPFSNKNGSEKRSEQKKRKKSLPGERFFIELG
jgi:hypothetical protein